jgi:aldehyde dehydrogenase (NAD+)
MSIIADIHVASKRHLIGGRWMESATGKSFDTFNPATGQVIARLAQGSAQDVDSAVRAARRAFEGPWSRWTPHERQRLLMRVHDIVEKHFDELAILETQDMGAPLSRTRSLKAFVLNVILYYATQTVNLAGGTLPNSLPGQCLTMSVKAPVGVVGGIIPWNGPIMGQWWVLGPALATGCTVVMKPAEDASLSVLRTAELLLEAGVPEGVVNVVAGFGSEAGAALAAHPDVDRIAFTGSAETGRKIVQASASNMKRLQLELGGKSPDIVFADADLDAAVPGAGMGVFANTGQICYAGTRLFVQRRIQDEFVERLGAYARTLKVGNGMEPDVQLGPVISKKQLDRVLHYVALGSREGATLTSGGSALTEGELGAGHFIEPTIFSNVRNEMTIAQEEIFGPVISVIPFDDADEALRLANDIEYGLGGAVWTRNASVAMKMAHGIKAGTVWVNCYGLIDPAVGFGGYKMSGYGWKGGPQHVNGFLYEKAIYMKLD